MFPSKGPRYRHIGEEQQTDLVHACCQTLASASTVKQLWVPPHQVLLRDHLCDLLGETGHPFLFGLTVCVYTETCCNDS